MNELFAEGGKRICVYDNVFDLAYRQQIYNFIQSSLFQIGWADGVIVENKKHMFLHSAYSEEDLERLGYLEALKATPVKAELDGYKVSKAVVNLSTPSDVNFVHAHPEDKVLLYYANLEWHDGWHGETLFYGEKLDNIVFASPYTPNRIISFDAKIPHTIRPQSHISAYYRFTFALILNKC